MKKNYIYFAVTAVIVVIAAFLLKNNGNSDQLNLFTSPSSTVSPSPTVSPSVSVTPKPKTSPKPTPALIAQEKLTYSQLTEILEKGGQWLALNDSCTEIVPSNVNYYNNTQIMLDNTASSKARILKIGGREYSLEARQWIMVTLSSDTLPMPLPIYCGTMELGRIDLVK